MTTPGPPCWGGSGQRWAPNHPRRWSFPRDYDREPFSGGGDVARFAETVAEYRAQVARIDAAAIGATVASLVPTGARVVVPADLPAAWVDVLTPSPTIQQTRCRSHNWRPQRRSSPAARWASR